MSDIMERYRNLVKAGFAYASAEKGQSPVSTFEIYCGHFSDIGNELDEEIKTFRARAEKAEAERDAAIQEMAKWATAAGRAEQTAEAAEKERDELRAAIFGSKDYVPALRNGNFVEMARHTHEARRFMIERAEAAEARVKELEAAITASMQDSSRCEHDGGFDREIGPIGCMLGDKCVCAGIYPRLAAALQSENRT